METASVEQSAITETQMGAAERSRPRSQPPVGDEKRARMEKRLIRKAAFVSETPLTR
jgi:hypothetical protein